MTTTTSKLNRTPNPKSSRWAIRLAAAVTAIPLLAAAGWWAASGAITGTAPASDSLRAAASLRPIGATDLFLSDAAAAADARPDDPDAQALFGAALIQLARETGDPAAYGRAAAVLDRALEIDPQNVEALIGQGSLALSRHEFARALDLGQRARELNPSVARSYGVIADALIELGRYEEAVATAQEMVDLRPDLASYSRVSFLRELHGDLPGAIRAMELAVSAGGPSPENTEYVRVQLGNLYFASGDLDAAAETYRRSLARLPNYNYALGGIARVEAARGNYDQAIDLYRRAAERLPLPELVIGLGETLEASGRAAEAADEYALVEAMQRLFAANGVRTDLELAAFMADHGSADDAVRLAQAAYAERPNIFAADALAWALHRAGRSSDALAYATEALRLGTQSSRLLYHAGVIEAAMGQTDAARVHLATALELNPAFSPLDAPRAAAALAELPE